MTTTVPARSPALRVLRNLVLAWAGLSLLGLFGAVLLSVYAMGWGCTAGGPLAGDASWGVCVLGWSVPIIGAVTSLACALVVLVFVQLFYWGGMEVRQSRPRNLFSRKALFDKAADEVIDEVVDELLD